ncbi:hypothetical protein ACWIUD_01550 [Helicobacter sp. 23-1044]
MLRILLLVIFMLNAAIARDVYIKGYTDKNGRYVPPHYRTKPNKSQMDNYSTKGNTNPYTGKKGTIEPYKKPKSNKQKRYLGF